MNKTTTSPDILDFCASKFKPSLKNITIYQQICGILKSAIELDLAKKNDYLPGSRVLAATFKVHRNTITAALEELASDGYVSIIPNKGCKVNFETKQFHKVKPTTVIQEDYHFASEKVTISLTTKLPIPKNKLWINLTTNASPYHITEQISIPQLLPSHYFAKTYSSILKRSAVVKRIISNSEPNSHLQPIINWIKKTRNLECSNEQIIFLPNRLFAVQQTIMAVTTENDIIINNTLSESRINALFQQQKCAISTIETNQQGININQLKQKITKGIRIKLVYVNPNHIYPNGQMMLLQNRKDLLELAQEQRFYIIEDDPMYDVFLKHQNHNSICSMDEKGNTLYIGDFDALLGSSLAVSYIIAPTNIINAIKHNIHTFSPFNIYLQTKAIAEFIQEGAFDKLQKKYRKTALQHFTECQKIIQQTIGSIATIEHSNNGLVFWISFLEHINLIQLQTNAHALGLQINVSQLFQNKETCAIRWCYGHQNTADVTQIAAILKLAYQMLHQ